jgi:uncharacterized protein (DUF1800 family)
VWCHLSVDERGAIAHLWRRAAFGARPDELDQLVVGGYDAAVDRLLAFGPDPAADAVPAPDVAPSTDRPEKRRLRRDAAFMVMWWLRRMVVAEQPLAERLAWFWHGHFATSLEKVRSPALMLAQHRLLRAYGAGDFEHLVQAVTTDPAMLVWLDGVDSTREHPNENLGRELLELFTLGVGNYTEPDVMAAARALTGWRFNRRSGVARLDHRRHDSGEKTFLGEKGALTGDDIVRIAVHRPACARWIAARMWSRFARPVMADDPVLDPLVDAFAARLDTRDLLRAVFRSPRFQDDDVRTGLVREPFLWIASVHRALGVDPELTSLRVLDGMGQVPFVPPDVAGWPENEGWLSAGAALARLRFAQALAVRVEGEPLASLAPSERVDGAAHLLAVKWSDPTARALTQVSRDPRSVLALALVAPEYVAA